MYPILKIMHMLNFLDTFSMSVTIYITNYRMNVKYSNSIK